MKTAISYKHSLNNVVLIMYKHSLTYFTITFFSSNSSHILLVGKWSTLKFYWGLQTMQTIASDGQSRVKKGVSTNDYAGLPRSKIWLKKWSRDMWTLPNGTFEWLEIYEPITYYSFWTRISFWKGRKKYFLKNFNLNVNVNVKKCLNERDGNKLFKKFF